MKKVNWIIGTAVAAAMALTACGGSTEKTAATTPAVSETATTAAAAETASVAETTAKASEPVTITIAAAASLETCLTKELIPLFAKQYPEITVQGTYDSSGKLQTQIEEGADVDVFFSAAMKQMNALKEKGMMEDSTIVELLENKIVLIVPKGEESVFTSFEDVVKADTIAIGDPESVPAGQYARESLTSLGIWEEVLEKSSLGTNVTEVLNWVAEGSAKAGIVYATDAAQTDQVSVVAEAPEGSVAKVIYPVGLVKSSKNQEASNAFIQFLQSKEAMEIFENNGFAAVQ